MASSSLSRGIRVSLVFDPRNTSVPTANTTLREKVGVTLKWIAALFDDMVINIGIALVASIATLFGTALLAKVVFNRGAVGVAVLQIIGMATLAYGLLSVGVVGIIGAGIIAAFPITTRLFAYLFVAWIKARAMSGKMGDETMWAAELVEEQDTEFIRATAALPSYELKEVGIIAESKEELRDLTIERYEQYKG